VCETGEELNLYLLLYSPLMARNKPADIVVSGESIQFRNDARSLTA
jgi:hypothetical protein